MRALLEAVNGFRPTAPMLAARLFERSQWVERLHWTFAEYDNASAGDIAFHREYLDMTAPPVTETYDG
jgi:hypothetical protein